MNLQESINRIMEVIRLNESKQVGIIYHFTKIKSAISICESDTLNADNQCLDGDYRFDPEDEKFCNTKSISFTREKDRERGQITINRPVKFIIDGNKLSHRYRIQPYNYYGDSKLELSMGNYGSPEFEERVFDRDITNFSKYLLGIEVDIFTEIYNNHFFKSVEELPTESAQTIYQQCMELISVSPMSIRFLYKNKHIPTEQLENFILGG